MEHVVEQRVTDIINKYNEKEIFPNNPEIFKN